MKNEIIYGIHPVHEALRSARRKIIQIFISEKRTQKNVKPIINLFEKQGIPIKTISLPELTKMLGNVIHQGIAAQTSPFPMDDFFQLIDDSCNFLLILDNIVDPQNLGALIRTAFATGVNGVIIPKDRSAQPGPAVSKSSAGALEHIHLCQVTNIVSAIKYLKEQNFWITGLDGNAKESLFD